MPKASINIPGFDSTISEEAKKHYDFIHSDTIKLLKYDDLISHFGGKEAAVNYCKDALTAGYPRSAAFLAAKVIKGAIAVDGAAAAKKILLEDLSMLSDEEIAIDADTLISKIEKPTHKKKIMFCSAHWLTGGMERVMSVLFRELSGEYDIFLITPYDERESQIKIRDDVTSIKISHDLFVGHFDSLILSYALLFEIDAVIGYMNMFSKQLNLYSICIGTGIKTIASNHEYYFYPYKSEPHYYVVEKRLNAFEGCDAVVWPNNFSAALCGLYIDHSYVIGNPNNFEVSEGMENPSENNVLCVGRFNDYVKRIDRTLECFSIVLKSVPDARLVLVGSCDIHAPISEANRTTINDLINILEIPHDRINFVGEVDNVDEYYASAKVFMLTSNSEGFGMVLNEAACHGLPSVANYFPGIEDIIVDGENGYITEQDDIKAMADRISNVLVDERLRKKLSKSAKEKVKSFDSKHIGNKWRYLISSLLEVKDKADLHKKLNSELGYKIKDQQLFLKVLSKELNEIFYMSIRGRGEHKVNNKLLFIFSKVAGLPKRLKANIEYEGLLKTVSKVITRSYRILRTKLKV